MTEAAWLVCEQWRRMAEHLGDGATDRKLRLFAVACARRTARLWGGARPLALLEAAERLADGVVPTESVPYICGCGVGTGMHFVHSAAVAALEVRAERAAELTAANSASSLGRAACEPFSYPKRLMVYVETIRAECVAQVGLLRDIFGNPFRPVRFSPAWRTSTAVALAAQMYDSGDFSATPILADALQDAGCDSEMIQNHCRDPHVTHVRGRWAVDHLLGKE